MYTKLIIPRTVIVLLIPLIFFMSACENNNEVEERIKLQEEPEIRVTNGEETDEQMKLEQYIKGVVAGEMKKNWPTNAYRAQAILARTFALKYMEENNTDTISGSFELAQEYKPEAVSNEIAEAVDDTRGIVILYKDEYIKSWFHASAGGHTTSARVGLAYKGEEPPYVKSVKSPDQKAPSDVKDWSVSFEKEAIEAALKKSGTNIGELREINFMDRDRSGRAIDFEFVGSRETARIKAANFRKDLDPKKLKSTKIEQIEKKDNNFIFTGSGFGHGVGLSQWGAYSLARDGKSVAEIIKYYFDNVELVKVYN